MSNISKILYDKYEIMTNIKHNYAKSFYSEEDIEKWSTINFTFRNF